MSRSDKKWMVRSSNHILGPYDIKEIEQLLADGNLSISDEVTSPCTFWSSFLGHPEFDQLIKQISFQARVTSGIAKITKELSLSKSQTAVLENNTIDKIQTFTQKIKSKTFPNKAKDAVFKTIKVESAQKPKVVTYYSKEKSQTAVLENNTIDKIQTFTQKIKSKTFPNKAKDAVFKTIKVESAQKPKVVTYYSKEKSQTVVNTRIKSFMSFAWKAIIVFTIIGIGYILYVEFFEPLRIKAVTLEEIRGPGLKFYQAGDYKHAFHYFQKGMNQNLLNFEEKVIISSLFIKEEQFTKAKEILNELSNQKRSDSRIPLLRGLIYWSEKNWALAKKSFLIKSKNIESQYGLINLGILEFTRNNYSSSLKYIKQVQERGYQRDLLLYLEAFNLVKINSEDALSYLQNIIKKSSEYHQESYLLIAYLYLKKGNEEMVQLFLQKSLNEDPFFSSEYKYNAFISKSHLNWKQLLNYCRSIYNYNEDNFLYNLIYGFCYLKIGSAYKGIHYLEKAKAQAPKNPLVLSIYAYYLMQNESISEAEIVLESAVSYNNQNFYIPYILKSYLYEKKEDWSSALKSWEYMLRIDDSHLSGMVGSAFNNFKLNRMDEMNIMREQVLERYPYHTRVLLLKN